MYMILFFMIGITVSLLFYIINLLVYSTSAYGISAIGNNYSDSSDSLVLTYECGFDSIHNQARAEHSLSYYVIALLYVIFDLEIALILPALVSIAHIGITGGVVLLTILTILSLAFIYELRLGVFNSLGS